MVVPLFVSVWVLADEALMLRLICPFGSRWGVAEKPSVRVIHDVPKFTHKRWRFCLIWWLVSPMSVFVLIVVGLSDRVRTL